MKVCSLYGAGFYYIPGTDTCIKIGGYVRAEYVFNGVGSGPNVYLTTGQAGGNDSFYNAANTRYYNWYSRYVGTVDTRSQTEYGTLRSYARIGATYQTGAQGSGDTETSARSGDGFLYFDRAFIQFAGFTFGKINSLMEFWGSYGVSNMTARGTPDTGGLTVAYYTAMLGNGVSATIGVEDGGPGRRAGIFNYNQNSVIAGGLTFGTAYGNNYGGTEIPDIIGDLRVSQAWGTAAVTGIAHQVRAGYYGTAFPGTTTAGRPGDKWGFAVTGGLDLNLPWAKGDHFVVQGSYAEGAIAQMRTGTRITTWKGGGDVTNLIAADAVFGTPGAIATGNLELTTGWSVIAGLEHYWMPNLRSSIWGDYAAIRYNGNAKAMLCNSTTGLFTTTDNAFRGNVGGTCNPDFNQYTLAGRTIWNPVPNLDIGLEVAYTKYEQNNVGTTAIQGVAPINAGNYAFGDYDVWAVNFRVQRNFWP